MSVDVAAANGLGVVAGRTTDGERGATTVGVIAGRASALTASEGTVPDESAVGVMSRGSVSAELPGGWGRVSGGWALEAWSSGQGFIEGRFGYQAGNYRAQWGRQVTYDDETGLQVNDNLSGRYSQGANVWAGVGAVITDEDAQAALDYVGSFLGEDEPAPSGGYAGSESGRTGFEGSPEVGPGHAAAVNEAAEAEVEAGTGAYAGSESGTTGFEGSPEIGGASYSDSGSSASGRSSSSGSDTGSGVSGPDGGGGGYSSSASGTTCFEGSPEVGGGASSGFRLGLQRWRGGGWDGCRFG